MPSIYRKELSACRDCSNELDISGGRSGEQGRSRCSDCICGCSRGSSRSRISASAFPHRKATGVPPVAAALSASCGAFAQSRAYATNEGAGTVSVIDIASDAVISTIDTGGKPRGLTVCKGSKKLYVTEQNKAQLWVIDPVKGVIEQRVQLGESPEALYCSPDGKWLGVANEGTNSISFIDVKSMSVKFSIKVKGKNPEHGVFSPDGKFMLVSAEEADQVDLLDLTKRKQIGDRKSVV